MQNLRKESKLVPVSPQTDSSDPYEFTTERNFTWNPKSKQLLNSIDRLIQAQVQEQRLKQLLAKKRTVERSEEIDSSSIHSKKTASSLQESPVKKQESRSIRISHRTNSVTSSEKHSIPFRASKSDLAIKREAFAAAMRNGIHNSTSSNAMDKSAADLSKALHIHDNVTDADLPSASGQTHARKKEQIAFI